MYPTPRTNPVTALMLAPMFTLVWALVTVSFFLMPMWGTPLGIAWVTLTVAAIVDALMPETD